MHMEKFYPNLDLKFLCLCPVCNCQYNPKEIKILDKKEGVVTIYFACAHCKNSIISAVNAGVLGVTAVSMITDLNIAEAEKIKDIPDLSADDVLTIYDFLGRENKQINRHQYNN